MKDVKQILRKKILNNENCKFDLLEKLLPVEELVTERLWFLRLKIADMLDIRVEDIKPTSLSQWRRRLKQREENNVKILSKKTTSKIKINYIFKPKNTN